MEFSNIFEKLKILFSLIVNSNIFTLLIIAVIAVILFRLKEKITNKKMIFIIYLIELVVLGITFFEGKEFLVSTGNTIIDNIFLNFYFPSTYVYLFVFVVSTVIFIYTLLNKFISKIYRTITYTYYLIFNFIFVILVNVIAKNNIDIFSKSSLFTNNDTLVLLELSTWLFFIYLITNSLIYITNSIIVFVGERKISTTTYNSELELVNPNVIEVEEKEESYLPNMGLSFQELVKNIEPVLEENNNSVEEISNPIKNEEVVELITNDTKESIIEEKVKVDLIPELKKYINNKEEKQFNFIDPILFEEPILDSLIKENKESNLKEKVNFIDFSILEKTKEDKLTLNDYKLFSNMLKVVVKNNNGRNLSVNDILNKVLLNDYSYEEYMKFEKILNSCLN